MADQAVAPPSPHRPALFLAGLVGLVFAAQLCLAVWPLAGAYLNTIVFMALLAIAVRRPIVRPFALLLAIVPVVAWISLVIPADTPRLFAIYGVLLALGVAFKLQLPPSQSLLARVPRLTFRHYFIALGTGVALGGISLTMAHAHPIAVLPLAIALPACIVFAFAEELFLRGLVQHQASRVVTANTAALLAIVAGICLSVGQGSVWLILLAFVGHGALSLLYRFLPSLALTTLANSTMKILWVAAVGFTIH